MRILYLTEEKTNIHIIVQQILSTSIYNLRLLDVCRFHRHVTVFFNFEHYRNTRAYILDPASMNFDKRQNIISCTALQLISMSYGKECCVDS